MQWVLALVALAGCGSGGGSGSDGGGGDDDAPPGDGAIDAPPGCMACSYGAVGAAGTVASAGAAELSGLAASKTIADTIWTHNDSGDGPRVFAISTTGVAKGIGTLVNATATDWEDIATAPCGSASCIYVADIGDNAMARASVRIYEADEPTSISGNVNLTFRQFDVQYPDGPHNSESLFVDPRDGASYIITKQATNPSTVFRMPRTTGATATAVSTGTITIPTGNLLVTGADFHTDSCGSKLIVRTYTHVFEYKAGATATIAQLIATTPVAVPVATETQGEAVTYSPDGRTYYTVSEGANPVMSRVACN